MLLTGVTPMPPERKTAGMLRVVVERERAVGRVQGEFRPDLHRLQDPLERGVPHPCRHHEVALVGALASENPRVFPSASVSGGLASVKSPNWPALYANPSGFSK